VPRPVHLTTETGKLDGPPPKPAVGKQPPHPELNGTVCTGVPSEGALEALMAGAVICGTGATIFWAL